MPPSPNRRPAVRSSRTRPRRGGRMVRAATRPGLRTPSDCASRVRCGCRARPSYTRASPASAACAADAPCIRRRFRRDSPTGRGDPGERAGRPPSSIPRDRAGSGRPARGRSAAECPPSRTSTSPSPCPSRPVPSGMPSRRGSCPTRSVPSSGRGSSCRRRRRRPPHARSGSGCRTCAS